MLLGVDLVGDKTMDKLLGPEKESMERPTGRTTDGDAKTEDPEERPGWDNENPSNSRFAPAFGSNRGDASGLSLSAEDAPVRPSYFGGNVRGALAKIGPSSQGPILSASDEPIRRVSFHQRLPTVGRLVPVSPTGEEVLPTTSLSEAK